MAKKVKLTKVIQSIIINNENNEEGKELDAWKASEYIHKEDGKLQRQSSQSAKKDNGEEGQIEKISLLTWCFIVGCMITMSIYDSVYKAAQKLALIIAVIIILNINAMIENNYIPLYENTCVPKSK